MSNTRISMPHVCPHCEPTRAFRHVDGLNAHLKDEHNGAPKVPTPVAPEAFVHQSLEALRALGRADVNMESFFLIVFLELATARIVRSGSAQLGDSDGVKRQLQSLLDGCVRDFLPSYLRKLRRGEA